MSIDEIGRTTEVAMDPYAALADTFLNHYDTIRGAVRYHLAAEQVDEHVPLPPATVIDVGAGAGHQAIRLAQRGYQVILVDPSEEMLTRAKHALGAAPSSVRTRIRLLQATGEQCPSLLRGERFDIVLCHGVFMYLSDPTPLARALVELARPGGIISVIAKNAQALAMRAALEHRWVDACQAMNATADIGGVGVSTRGDRLDRLVGLFEREGCQVRQWYGIRVFTDHLGRQRPGPELPDILTAERLAGRTDPYRSVARLLHVVAQRT